MFLDHIIPVGLYYNTQTFVMFRLFFECWNRNPLIDVNVVILYVIGHRKSERRSDTCITRRWIWLPLCTNHQNRFFCSQQILCVYGIVHAFEWHREEDSAYKRNLSAIKLQSYQISRY